MTMKQEIETYTNGHELKINTPINLGETVSFKGKKCTIVGHGSYRNSEDVECQKRIDEEFQKSLWESATAGKYWEHRVWGVRINTGVIYELRMASGTLTKAFDYEVKPFI